MRNLSGEAFHAAAESIDVYGRPLERKAYQHIFEDGGAEEVLNELGKYQNEDGGFGNALEPDFRLPDSSPLATSVAFQHMEMLDGGADPSNLVDPAIGYLEGTYDEDRGGWYSVPEKVNDHPHAPWWHYDPGRGGTVIDDHWGNPTAEIAGYLSKYRNCVSELDVDSLIERTIGHINSKDGFESPNEIYCYIRLYDLLPGELSSEMEDQITKGVEQLVEVDPEAWVRYVPQPLHFVNGQDSPRFGIAEGSLEKNLDFLVDILESKGRVDPSWEWGSYQAEWGVACKEWIGILTLRALVTLRDFGRL
ncbi:MAG: hypothetical protein ACOCSO_01335 [Thermoplasmatota archaeon]